MKVFAHIKSFLKDEQGASGIEYALVAAMVAVVIANYSKDIGTAVDGVMNSVKTGITKK